MGTVEGATQEKKKQTESGLPFLKRTLVARLSHRHDGSLRKKWGVWFVV